MIICERCANRQNCECTPYDVECDTRFKDVKETNKLIRDTFDAHMKKHNDGDDE